MPCKRYYGILVTTILIERDMACRVPPLAVHTRNEEEKEKEERRGEGSKLSHSNRPLHIVCTPSVRVLVHGLTPVHLQLPGGERVVRDMSGVSHRLRLLAQVVCE